MELVRLPSPPHVLSKLLDVCHNPDSSIGDLVNVISADAALTSKTFMAISSKAFAVSQPIDNLEQAVTLIGHDLMKTMAITSSIQQLFAGLISSQKEFICAAWLDSLYCAVFARDIAIALNYEHPQDAYLAGLLHDIGQIVFDARFHDQYVGIVRSSSEAETITKEISKFGVSHTELGADIIEQWPSLSPAIADAARFHHEDKDQLEGCDVLCQIVAEASQLARHWSQQGKVDTKWKSSLISDKDLKGVYIHVQDKLAQVVTMFGVSLPNFRNLTQAQFSNDLDKETIKLARKIRDASLIKVIGTEETQTPIPDSPTVLLMKVARELQLFFSVSDVVLLFHDPQDPESLTLYEVGFNQPTSKFSIGNSNSQVVKSFLDKKQLWIEPAHTELKKSPITDRQLIRRLNHEIAMSFPIVHEDKAFGTVVIGCHKTQRNNLEKLSDIFTSHLEGIAEMWLKNSRNLSRQTFEDNIRTGGEQKDIDKLIHEIGNPLSVIGNYIDIMKSDSGSGENGISKDLDVVKEELQRVRNIVLNFKEGHSTEPQAVLLNSELENCIPLYVKSIGKENEVQIMWSLDKQNPEINITQDALRQIILNLVKNAVEAQTEDAAIMIASSHFVNIGRNFYAQFSISDRGKGVDAKNRELIFSPLTSTKKGAGRGYGLSVADEILQNFDGQIKYMKNEVGGALFEVLIPLSLKQ